MVELLLRFPMWEGGGVLSVGLRLILGSVLLGAILLGGGCAEERGSQDVSEGLATEREDAPARALVVQCKRSEGGVVTFRALVRPDSLTLQVPAPFGGGVRRLASVRAASGAKYEGGSIMVWSKGSTATVEIEGRRFRDCSMAPQTERRRSGLQFRAIGQEPGWIVEVTDDSLRFAWAYGQHEVITPRFSTETDVGRIVYTAETDRGTVRVVAESQRCADSMNGRLFSHTVTVTLAGDTHTGCGRPLP